MGTERDCKTVRTIVIIWQFVEQGRAPGLDIVLPVDSKVLQPRRKISRHHIQWVFNGKGGKIRSAQRVIHLGNNIIYR